MVSYRSLVVVVFVLILAMAINRSVRMSADEPVVQAVSETSPAAARNYDNRLQRLSNPAPLLADHPQYVQPVRETVRYEAKAVVVDKDADLSVRAWRFSSYFRAAKTCWKEFLFFNSVRVPNSSLPVGRREILASHRKLPSSMLQ